MSVKTKIWVSFRSNWNMIYWSYKNVAHIPEVFFALIVLTCEGKEKETAGISLAHSLVHFITQL